MGTGLEMAYVSYFVFEKYDTAFSLTYINYFYIFASDRAVSHSTSHYHHNQYDHHEAIYDEACLPSRYNRVTRKLTNRLYLSEKNRDAFTEFRNFASKYSHKGGIKALSSCPRKNHYE